MLSSWRVYLTLLVTGSLVAIAALVATTPGDSPVTGVTEASHVSPSTLSIHLSVPGVEQLDGGEQESAQLLADRADPAVVWARRASRTRYEHLGSGAVVRVIDRTVPAVLNLSPAGVGQLPVGARVSRYLSVNAARIDLHGGKRVVVESTTPVATRTSSGSFAPVDLALRESGQGFVADNAAVPVSIPRSLASGVKLEASDVSLTPVSASGDPLAGKGNIDGGAVVYPNTGTDSDTAAKPIASGLEMYDTLRSADSPQRLLYRIGMPRGASLVVEKSGTVSVVASGRPLAAIARASAVDAAGTSVPISTSVSGDTLDIKVDHRSSDYLYPIVVDPTVIDSSSAWYPNWRYESGGPAGKSNDGYALGSNWRIQFPTGAEANQWGAMVYPTQGESHIYQVSMETSASTNNSFENHLVIAGSGGWEGSTSLAKSYGRTAASACVGLCSSSEGSAENIAAYWLNAISSTSGMGEVIGYQTSVYISQKNGPSIAEDTTKERSGGFNNVFYGSGGWLSPSGGAAVFDTSDPGIGVDEMQYTVAGSKWGYKFAECETGVQCYPETTAAVHATEDGGLPEGEHTIEAKALNAMGSSSTTTATIKVDRAAPHEITLSGLPSGNVINDATQGGVKLVAHATDGVTGTVSSGVASLKLSVDGRESSSPNGSCSPGPCTATGEWTINGEEFAVGEHTLTVTATDAAGNVATSNTSFSVHHANPVSFGPGDLNPVTGEFDLEETDVSVSTTGTPLSIARGYDSREPTAGSTGPFGAPWSLGAGGAQRLVRFPNGNMTLISTTGSMSTFTAKSGGVFEPPAGDSSLVLTANAGGTEYTLQDKGASTVFKHISGDVEGVFLASIASGTAGSNTTQYTYQFVGGVVELEEELGPVPAGVSCTPTLNPGCRALTFNYATTTTATGESESEWGDYLGRLTRVYFTTGEVKEGKVVQVTKTVAQYAYDSKGRLRAEWDPRVSPALKTTYGYDAEGHVTVVYPAGKEGWAFTYGTTPTDTRPGRLIKAMRPSATEALWGGEALKNTVAPTLTGTPVFDNRLTVSNGSWSGSPIDYAYQWEDCNGSGLKCKPIAGATNASYWPVLSDGGHKLVVQVTATNGGGSVVASTAASAMVVAGSPAVTQSLGTSALDAVSCIPGTSDCVVGDSKGNTYYSTNVSVSSAATWTAWSGPGSGPSESLSCPATSLCTLAAGEKTGGGGNLYYATSLGGGWTQAAAPASGSKAISCATTSLCVEGESRGGLFRITSKPASKSWTFDEQGSSAMKAVSCLSTSFCAIGDSSGEVHVATSNAQIFSAEWAESNVDGTTALNGLACTSASACVAVDAAGNVLNLTVAEGGAATATRQNIDGSNSLTAISCSASTCVTVDGYGEVFVSTDSGRTWTLKYLLEDDLTSVSCASSKLCVAVDTSGHLFSFDATVGSGTEGEAVSPQPGTTVEYNVPVSGSGAPYQLSSGEAAKWAQTDVPAEATAIFPVDEPVGWPAPDYRRATIDYLDIDDRIVNVASPGGGIVTSEYNSRDDVVRNLSADNRAAALKEGSKSAEASQALDTQNTYSSDGTELLSVLGPLHTVKLASGATVKAREHTVYSYDEGAPETGGPYRLVTKVTEGAQISGEPEADVRTTNKSYGGQNDLGWMLREPTATTVDPSGLNLKHSTVFDPNSGKVTETRTPAAGSADESYVGYEYSSAFGHAGSGNGEMYHPEAVARDAEGNLWVADTGNNRVEEFSSGGTFIRKFSEPWSGHHLEYPSGIAIDGSGNVWVVDTGYNKVEEFTTAGTYVKSAKLGGITNILKHPSGLAYSAYNKDMYIADSEDGRIVWWNVEKESEYGIIGKAGAGNGEFLWPEGIAIDSTGNLWVSDASSDRIQELSSTGTYIFKFGSEGSGNGQLEEPQGIALDGKGNILVADSVNNRVQAFSTSGAYQYQFGEYGSGTGQMKSPAALDLDSEGNAYVLDSYNSRIQKWLPSGNDHKARGTGGVHGEQTVYYSAGANGEVSGCGYRPEWAGMPCEQRPAAQPETSGVPNLPVTATTYNVWDEPVESVETVGSSTRTNTNVYDEAGRLVKDTVSSSVGTALPSVEYEYNSETGEATKSKTTVEGMTRTLESTHDKRGELTSYKDADGSTSSFYYDPYGRLESLNDGKGTQAYSYDTTTGMQTKLVDSATGTFTANYDVEGNLTSVSYPNGMSVTHTYDSTGSETGIEYLKTTHCTTGCTWYSQDESPSIHGQALSLTSTLSSQSYAYDAAGRLTKVQDTPTGEGCTTRIYAYDQETNIDSLTTRAPGTGGACATEGGTAVNHSYDPANRLTDGGIGYDTFGDIVKLPASDAGGHELASMFYADETLASQSQNGQTIGYYLDPEGRDRQIVSTGTVNSTVTYHYAGDGDSPAWTEDTTGKWTRNIYGFEGLVAIQSGGESPVLQVQDLKGDVVGTASLSETATGLSSKGDGTEYGVPRTSSPPKYSWQGGAALRTELPSGVIAMGARSYVPEIGRFLQPDPVEGGSANEYAYTYGDPVNSADPSGEYTVATPSWVGEFFDEEAEIATEAAIQRAAEEQAAREEAEEKAREAAEEAAEAAEAAAEAAAEGYSGGGGKKAKAKKGKAKAAKPVKVAKAAKSKVDIAASRKAKGKSCTGPGPYKCAKPGTGTKTIKESKKDGGKAARELVGGIIQKAGEEWEQSEREKISMEEWEECWYHEAC